MITANSGKRFYWFTKKQRLITSDVPLLKIYTHRESRLLVRTALDVH